MEIINVNIAWSGKNYSALIEDVNGIVIATHKTLEGIKKEISEALDFHVEGLVEDGDEVPQYLIDGHFDFNFKLLTSAILKQIDGIVSRSALAKASKINERQLGHYIQGRREAREGTRKKVIEGIQVIRENLSRAV